MSASPQAIASNPYINLLNVYIQIANKMGFKLKKKLQIAYKFLIPPPPHPNPRLSHSFISHSVNPYKVKWPIGYRTCHDTNVI
jgi:hypothetical protein